MNIEVKMGFVLAAIALVLMFVVGFGYPSAVWFSLGFLWSSWAMFAGQSTKPDNIKKRGQQRSKHTVGPFWGFQPSPDEVNAALAFLDGRQVRYADCTESVEKLYRVKEAIQQIHAHNIGQKIKIKQDNSHHGNTLTLVFSEKPKTKR